MKRLVVAAAMAVGLMLSSSGAASASYTHCDWDPLVLVITPSGHLVPVYDSVWTSNLLSLGLPLESYTVSRVYVNGSAETSVDMTIYTPTGLLFRYYVFDEVTTGLLGGGTVLASAYGSSGSAVHLKFVLPQA